MHHCLPGTPGREFSAWITFLGAVPVACETGGQKLTTRDASKRVARAGKYVRTVVMVVLSGIQAAAGLTPGVLSPTLAVLKIVNPTASNTISTGKKPR